MFKQLTGWLWDNTVDWLNTNVGEDSLKAVCDFDQLLNEIRPADVILFEGRSRVGEVIKLVTLSPWTHAALYIGRLSEITDPKIKKKIEQFYQGDPNEPLVIESLLGYGTIINPLTLYKDDHLRVCRPSKLTPKDQERIIPYALDHLGLDYDVRQLLDLARLLFPYSIIPRKWRSSLFQHNAGKPTHIVCSSMIARCFQHVKYPVLPIVQTDKKDRLKMYHRNFRLFIPKDFDASPFFCIIKFPSPTLIEQTHYKQLPWSNHSDPAPELKPRKDYMSAFREWCFKLYVKVSAVFISAN